MPDPAERTLRVPEIVSLDETPLADDGEQVAGYACPECTRSFTSSPGLKRHLTRTHGAAPTTPGSASSSNKGSAGEDKLAKSWRDFQQGTSVLVALACVTCGRILSEDAETDGNAIAAFAVKRPKLKKQLESFLASADFLVLMGAVGGTAQKMLGHHSIGRKLGIGTGHAQSTGHNPMERMAQFMAAMPPEARHRIIDQAIVAQQAQQQAQQERRSEPAMPTAEAADVPGAEPTIDVRYTPEDAEMMAKINTESFETVDAMG